MSHKHSEKAPASNKDGAEASPSHQDPRLSAFLALGLRLNAARTSKEAGRIIVAAADQLLGWDCCLLDLYSPEEDVLIHVLNSDVIDGRRTEFPPKYSHMPPSALARRAMVEGGVLVLKEDPSKMLAAGRPFGDASRPSASIMFVPIRDGGTVTGILSIQSYTPNAYDQQSLATLQALADHCGGALSRIRMAEALQHRLEMESMVSRLSSRFVNLPIGETDAAVSHALELLGTSTGADQACVVRYAGVGREVARIHQWHAEGVEPFCCAPDGPLAQSSSWWVEELRRSEVISIPRLSALPAEAAAEKRSFEGLGIRSLLAAPFRRGDACLGYLWLSSVRRERLWNPEHVSVAKVVGEILANAFQHERAAERIERLNRLYSVRTRISGLIVRTPALEVLCEEACRIVVDCGLFRVAWVSMVEPDTRAIKLVGQCGFEAATVGRLRISAAGDVPEGLGPTGTAIREGRYNLCNDAFEEPRMAPWRDVVVQYGNRSVAAFPLKVKGRVVGALTLADTEPYAFDDEQLALLEELSGDLSFAIEIGGQAKQLQLQSTALEAAANSIVITDAAGVVSWVNPAFTKLTGHAAQDAIGKQMSLLKSGQHDARFYEGLRATIAAGEVWRGEIVNRRKDGGLYNEELTITPVRGEAGEITHYVEIKQDITERKQAERLTAAVAKLGQGLGAARTAREAAEIIATVADHLLGWDAFSLNLYSTDNKRMIHVLTRDTINGQRVDCPALDPDAPPSERIRRAVESGGELVLREKGEGMPPDVRPFGDTSRPSASILRVPVGDGASVIGVLSIHSYAYRAYDEQSLATLRALANHCGGALQRIRAQQALDETEANYRLLVEGSPDAMIVHTEDRFIYANQAALKLAGASSLEQLVSRPILDLVPEEHRSFVGQRIRSVAAGDIGPAMERRLLRLDGTAIEVEARGLPCTYQGKPAVQTVIRDISERKRADARLAAISSLGYRLSAARTAKAAARIILEVADQLIGWDACLCDLYSPREDLMISVLVMDIIDGRRAECMPRYDRSPLSRTAKRTIEEGGQLILRQQSADPRRESLPFGNHKLQSASLMFVPVRNGANVIGVLSIQSYTYNAYNQQSLETLQALADHCGAALERIRTEEELHSSQARLQLQFDHMPLACITWDREHRVTSWNPAAERIFGYSALEAAGKHPHDFLVPKQLQPEVDRIGQRLIEGQADLHTVSENQTKDGRSIFCDWTSVPLRNPDGSVIGVLSMVQDVTERQRAEEELRWKTAFLEAQVNCSLDGILIIDRQFRKVLQNQQMARVLKIPPDIAEDSDRRKQIEYVAQNTKNPQEFIEKVLRLNSDPNERSRDELVLRDGTILDRFSAPVVGKDGTHYGRIWTHRDITESRKLEAQLRHSQKMEAIGQLAGGVAHDFNNLLAVIRGNTELVLMDPSRFPAEVVDCLNQVVGATDRAAGLTRQLLTFGRKQIMRPQPLNLTEAVGNLTKMLKRVIGEDIDLRLRHAGDLPIVHADVGMIEQALVNLVVNARDAMPQGGQLVIATEPVAFTTGDQEHPEARAGEFVCLSVTDTGTGIAAEHLPKIFEPFYTTKDVGKGSGLGLATVYGIVKQHQGWVEVSSQPGAGSTFRIFLPAYNAPAISAPAETALATPRGGTETILLVEDDEAVRRLTRLLLERSGYRVQEASSGCEALDFCHDHLAEINLLITDVIMPGGVSGRDLVERLWAQRPGLKVIFMSGYSGEALGKDTDFLRQTNSRFLPKPCSQRDLLLTVRASLDQS